MDRRMRKASYRKAIWVAMGLLLVFSPWQRAAAAPAQIGHAHALLVLPGSPRLLMGTHKGLLMSRDDGRTWMPVPLPPKFQGTDVMSLVVDPGDVRRVYAGTHDWGVRRGLDGGKTWEEINTGLGGRDVHALTIDPNRPKTLHAWVVGKGLYRTRNGGATWTRVDDGPENPEVKTLASVNVATGMGGIYLYAGTATGLYRNPDCF